MTPRSKKTTAMVLAGSVALASTAYAIGSQAGGGSSGAATTTGSAGSDANWHGDPAASLASRLGVSEARLRAAFDAIRKSDPPPGGDPRGRFEKALADALGLDQSKVAGALDRLRTQHEAREAPRRDAFAKALASELGLDATKVSDALDALRPDRVRRAPGPPPGGFGLRLGPGGPPPGGPPPGGPPPRRFGVRVGPDSFVAALAKKLGVDASKLRAALEKVRPAGGPGGPRPGGPGRPGGPRLEGPPPGFADDLAQVLGVKSSDVTAALEKIHSQIESEMTARRDKLAGELANRLGLPVQKVKDALAAEFHGP